LAERIAGRQGHLPELPRKERKAVMSNEEELMSRSGCDDQPRICRNCGHLEEVHALNPHCSECWSMLDYCKGFEPADAEDLMDLEGRI